MVWFERALEDHLSPTPPCPWAGTPSPGRRNNHGVSDLRFCPCSSLMAADEGDDNEDKVSLLSYFVAPTGAEQEFLPPLHPWAHTVPGPAPGASDTPQTRRSPPVGVCWVGLGSFFSPSTHSPNLELAAGSLWGGAEGTGGDMRGQSQASRTSSCSTQGGTERGQALGR